MTGVGRVVVAVSSSAGLKSPSLFLSSVPAAVGNLSLGNAGTSDLTITWSPAPGDVDHYEV